MKVLAIILTFFTIHAQAGDRVFRGVDDNGEPCSITLRYLSNQLFAFHASGTANLSVPAEKNHAVRLSHQFDGNPMRLNALGISPQGSEQSGRITVNGGGLELTFDLRAKTFSAVERKVALGPISWESIRLNCKNVELVEDGGRPASPSVDVSAPTIPAGRK